MCTESINPVGISVLSYGKVYEWISYVQTKGKSKEQTEDFP